MKFDENDKMINGLINNFINKNQRDRVRLLLKNDRGYRKFCEDLCHNYGKYFNLSKLIPLENNEQGITNILKLLGLADEDKCFFMTSYGIDMANRIVPIGGALEEAMWHIDCALLISLDGKKIFLRPEDYKTDYYVGNAG